MTPTPEQIEAARKQLVSTWARLQGDATEGLTYVSESEDEEDRAECMEGVKEDQAEADVLKLALTALAALAREPELQAKLRGAKERGTIVAETFQAELKALRFEESALRREVAELQAREARVRALAENYRTMAARASWDDRQRYLLAAQSIDTALNGGQP